MKNFPNITLEIKNFKISLIYSQDDKTSRRISTDSEDILLWLDNLAMELGLEGFSSDHTTRIEEYLKYAREASDEYLDSTTEMDLNSLDFELSKIAPRNVEEELAKIKSLPENIKTELENNIKQDVFANTLEKLYSVLIAKTLLAASDLGLGLIALSDSTHNSRLRERMAHELEKLGVEFLLG